MFLSNTVISKYIFKFKILINSSGHSINSKFFKFISENLASILNLLTIKKKVLVLQMTLPGDTIFMNVIIAINYFDFDFWSGASIPDHFCAETHLILSEQILWFNNSVFKVTEVYEIMW